MNILISTSSFGDVSRRPLELLEAAGHRATQNPHKRQLTEAEARELYADADGVVAGTEKVTAGVLERAPRLKCISRVGTGVDGVDLKAAAARGIPVFNTPEAHVDAVAELVLGGTLAVLRRLGESDRAIRRGEWNKPMGALLRGKTVGIVGHGRIGARVANIAVAFGCSVLACDERPFQADGVVKTTLEGVLRTADLVSLHVPLEQRNRHMIDARALALMKKGAVLINTSRGGLVDESALTEALRSGRLTGIGLDAFETEPYQGPLREFPNAVLTAHMGSAAVECRTRMEKEAASNLLEGLRRAGVL